MTIKTSIANLLQAKELKNLLSLNDKFDKNFRILEANMGNSAKKIYDLGHIDKAIYIDASECSEPTQLFPRALPDLNDYKDYVGSLGISNKHHLIIYDRSPFGFYASSRLWQTFKIMGHKDLSILNGGINSWMHNNYPLSSEVPDFKKEEFKMIEINKKLQKSYEDITENTKGIILDARGARDFENDNIQNSINVPYNDLFNPMTGLMKSKEELLEVFKEHNVDLSKPLITSCMTGMTANALAFALDIVGIKDVPVYFGSWTEYAQRKYE